MFQRQRSNAESWFVFLGIIWGGGLIVCPGVPEVPEEHQEFKRESKLEKRLLEPIARDSAKEPSGEFQGDKQRERAREKAKDASYYVGTEGELCEAQVKQRQELAY